MLRRSFICSLPFLGYFFQSKEKAGPPSWSVMAVVLAQNTYRKWITLNRPKENIESIKVRCIGETKIDTIIWSATIYYRLHDLSSMAIVRERIELPKACIALQDRDRLSKAARNFISNFIKDNICIG